MKFNILEELGSVFMRLSWKKFTADMSEGWILPTIHKEIGNN
jgi:hypothetical protein